MAVIINPDEIIEDLGGCGPYQWRMSIVVHAMQTVICFSVATIIAVTKTPPIWYCDDENNISLNDTFINNNSELLLKSCTSLNGTVCSKFRYEGMTTIVSSFDLVCEKTYVPAAITSIQISGMLVGNLVSGQLADLYGRKRPLFLSFVILIISNIAGFASTSWYMLAVSRFFIGAGSGFFLTIQYNLLSEFTLSKWRAWVTGFPSWPIQGCLFALVAWLIQDWRYIMLMCGLTGIPCMFAWWIIQERFRWYISHDRPIEAVKVIQSVTKYNKPLESKQMKQVPENSKTNEKDTQYTLLYLFKSKYLTRITLLASLNWAGLGLVSYGITFGIQALSGNLFLNMFLFSLTGIPAKTITIWLQNRIGRKKTSMLCYIVVAFVSFIVGIVQYIDTGYRVELTNAFAIVASTGITMAWGPVQTMTVEFYPTVIRNIGFGSLSVIGRIGAILGPQLVLVSTNVPGLLYFVCGGFATLCIFALFGLPETMNANLSDKIQESEKKLKSNSVQANVEQPHVISVKF